MDIATILEIAKISPYLVIPALAGFLLYKVNKENMKFIKSIVDDRGNQFEVLSTDLKNLNTTVSTKLDFVQKELKEKQEAHDKAVQGRIEKVVELLNEYRLEAVRGGK